MGEMEEMMDMVKESGTKLPKQKLGRKGKITLITISLTIAILLGTYMALALITPPPEKYCKSDIEFVMPSVDWSAINSNYVLERTTYDQDGIGGDIINQMIGSKKSNGNFEVEIVVKVMDYSYYPEGSDEIHTMFYVSFTKLSGDYRVKELVFKYEVSDDDVGLLLIADSSLVTSKNLYFTADTGNYPTPYGPETSRRLYEFLTLHQIRGINKDARDIKDGGFSYGIEVELFDPTTSGKSHNITFYAILHYGKYVHGLFGDHWEDMYTLDAYVKIYIVPEGGEIKMKGKL